ncbi:MAG: prepilin peptidase [Lachnospiraceae bacterium]|nr:prepilin peptidase [Lachnospiraceae bacterium]
MRIILLVILFYYAYQDIRYRSISIVPAIAFFTLTVIRTAVAEQWMAFLCGLLPAVFCLVIYLMRRMSIGPGDIVMLAMIGTEIGMEGTIITGITASLVTIAYYLISRFGDILNKRRLRASVTIEAAFIVPIIMLITLAFVDAGCVLHQEVKEEAEIEWDEEYCVNSKYIDYVTQEIKNR